MTGLAICDPESQSDVVYPLPVRLPVRLVDELRKQAKPTGALTTPQGSLHGSAPNSLAPFLAPSVTR
jgi:hypothetical protein